MPLDVAAVACGARSHRPGGDGSAWATTEATINSAVMRRNLGMAHPFGRIQKGRRTQKIEHALRGSKLGHYRGVLGNGH